MAAYAEGLNILANANAGGAVAPADAETAPDPRRTGTDVAEVAEVWRRGSVVSSWLLDLTAAALYADPELDGLEGAVADSGEGRWAAIAAIEEGVPADVLTAALFARFSSRDRGSFANRVLSAMRLEFGGHAADDDPSRGAPGRRGPRGPGGGGDRGGRGRSGGRSRHVPLGGQRRGDARPDVPPARVCRGPDRDVPGRRAGRPRGGRRPEPHASPPGPVARRCAHAPPDARGGRRPRVRGGGLRAVVARAVRPRAPRDRRRRAHGIPSARRSPSSRCANGTSR